MTTNKGLIVHSVIIGFLYGATIYCSMVGSFYRGAAAGFKAGRKKGLEEVHETIASAYNDAAEARGP